MPAFQVINRPPDFSEQLGAGLGQGLSQGIGAGLTQMLQQKERNKQLQGLAPIFEQFGIPKEGVAELLASGLDPKDVAHLAGQLGQQQAKFQTAQLKSQEKEKERTGPLKQALNVVKRQRELLAGGDLGPKLGRFGQAPKLASTFTKKGQKARSEYQQLGKSLISFASNIPIRNQQEFNTLAERLFDVTLTESEMEGTLDAMERVIKNALTRGEEEEDIETPIPKKESNKKRPSLADILG